MSDGNIRFNKAFYPNATTKELREESYRYNNELRASMRSDPIVFISHKTGDQNAEQLAREITRTHKVVTYLAEWDDNVEGDSVELPDYIMNVISNSKGFLVCVRQSITYSMWIGYEIGGAHANDISSAKTNFQQVRNLPSVLEVLESLESRAELDDWIRKHVIR